MERFGVFGLQAQQQVQVVGIHLRLWYVSGWASRARGDDGLHFEVTALHQTHLQRRATLCRTLLANSNNSVWKS